MFLYRLFIHLPTDTAYELTRDVKDGQFEAGQLQLWGWNGTPSQIFFVFPHESKPGWVHIDALQGAKMITLFSTPSRLEKCNPKLGFLMLERLDLLSLYNYIYIP